MVKNSQIRFSLKFKLIIIYVALISAALLIMGYVSFQVARDTLIKKSLDELNLLTELKTSEISNHFLNVEHHFRLFQENQIVKAQIQQLVSKSTDTFSIDTKKPEEIIDEQSLFNLKELNLNNLIIVNIKGETIYSFKKQHDIDLINKKVLYLNQETINPSMSKLNYSIGLNGAVKDGCPLMYLWGPLKDPQGELIGVMVFDINLSPINDLTKHFKGIGFSGDIFLIIEQHGSILFLNHHDSQQCSNNINPLVMEAINELIHAPENEMRNEKVMNNKWVDKFILSHHHIQLKDHLLNLVVKVEKNEIFLPMHKLRIRLLGVLLVVLILSIVSVLFYAHVLTKPLERLILAAGNVSSGNFLNTIMETNQTDEIGSLTEAFNLMIKNLREKTVSIDALLKEKEQREKAEELIRVLSAAVESSAVSIVITNIKGNIEYVNPWFSKVTGYTLHEALKSKPNILKSGIHPPDFYKNMWNHLLSGKEWHGEIFNKKKNGDLFWEEVLISPIKDNKGDITHFVAIKEDITERKEMNEKLIKHEIELKKKNDELEEKNVELEKLDKIKSDFVSVVSHELRTPLAISIESHNLILDGIVGQISDKQNQILTTSRDNLYRLNTIINDLLDIHKIESGKITLRYNLININKLLEDVTHSFKRVFETKRQVFHLVLPKKEVFIYIDAEKIIQVLNNLLSNAYKFTPEEGKIEIALIHQQDNLLFQVKNTGPGLTKDEIPRLFEKFYQLNRGVGPGIKGTGLGLAITKALIEHHQGKIWVESEPAKETIFNFTIPYFEYVKKNFDQRVEKIIIEAESLKSQTLFISLKFIDSESSQGKLNNEEVVSLMNNVLFTVAQVFKQEEDFYLLYDDKTILFILPKTNYDCRHRLINKISEVMRSSEYEQIANRSYLFNFGVVAYPLHGSDGKSLITAVLKDALRQRKILFVGDDDQFKSDVQMMINSLGVKCLAVTKMIESISKLKEFKPDLVIVDKLDADVKEKGLLEELKVGLQTLNIPIIAMTKEKVISVENEYYLGATITMLTKDRDLNPLMMLIRKTLNIF